MSNSLRPHEPQHVRPPCPSPTARVYPNPCPLSRWCHPAISPSVVPFSSCPQSFPASGSFPMSQFFISGGQSIGASASTSVLPVNIQGWFPLGLTGLIALQSKRLSGVFSNTTVQKHQFFGAQLSLWSDSQIHTWLLVMHGYAFIYLTNMWTTWYQKLACLSMMSSGGWVCSGAQRVLHRWMQEWGVDLCAHCGQQWGQRIFTYHFSEFRQCSCSPFHLSLDLDPPTRAPLSPPTPVLQDFQVKFPQWGFTLGVKFALPPLLDS